MSAYDVKISSKHVFTAQQLFNYLVTVKKFSKLEEEILATLTYKKAYDEVNQVKTSVGFPYKENKETDFRQINSLNEASIGDFLKKFSEQDSPYDSFLVQIKNGKTLVVRPLQIKFIGKEPSSIVTEREFIKFLQKHSRYEENRITLVIVAHGKIRIRRLEDVSDWLKVNKFPFSEVVLINPNNKSGEMSFFQLKPCGDSIVSLKFDRDVMLGELKNVGKLENQEDKRFWYNKADRS